jgi:transposase InsO family protein
MFFEEQGEQKPTHIIRDRDSKFTSQFCSILELEGVEFREIPPLSPNLNPFAEAWVQRVKRECLDFFVVFGERHLRHILGEWLDYYHRFRPHQGLGNAPLGLAGRVVEFVDDPCAEEIVCRERLGGVVRYYERPAA